MVGPWTSRKWPAKTVFPRSLISYWANWIHRNLRHVQIHAQNDNMIMIIFILCWKWWNETVKSMIYESVYHSLCMNFLMVFIRMIWTGNHAAKWQNSTCSFRCWNEYRKTQSRTAGDTERTRHAGRTNGGMDRGTEWNQYTSLQLRCVGVWLNIIIRFASNAA